MNFLKRHLLILTWAIICLIFFPISVLIFLGIVVLEEVVSITFVFITGLLVLSFFPILFFDYKRNKQIKEKIRKERKNQPKTCPKCGVQVQEGNQFCIRCGVSFDESPGLEEISDTDKNFQGKVSFWRSNLNNPFGKVFSYYFFPFLFIVGVLGFTFNYNPTIIGIMVAFFFPFIAGFFTLFLLYPIIFQKLRNKKLYSGLIPILSLVLFVPIWILGFLNMYLGFFVFVYYLVVGNMKSIFNKQRYNRVPTHKFLNVIIVLIAFILPILLFSVYLINDVGFNNLFSAIVIKGIISYAGVLFVGYIAVWIVCPTSLFIVIFFDKGLGKRVALFCLLFVWVIITWILKIIGEFSAPITITAQAPIIFITLYNIFNQTKKFGHKHVEKFEESVNVGKRSLTYNVLNRFINEDALDALTFVFFCSAFFGYLTAVTGLTSLSISLKKLLTILNIKGLQIPDFGVVLPYFIQIVIAISIVFSFLIYNIYKYRKDDTRGVKS